jgi:hypothetical protein
MKINNKRLNQLNGSYKQISSNRKEIMMKKLTLTAMMLLLLLSALFGQKRTDEKRTTVVKAEGDTTVTESVVISKSEDITPRRHMFVVNPLKFFLFYNLTYYQQVSNSVGVGVGLQTPTLKGLDGYGINAEVRFYPSGKTLRGFYVSPNISYNKISSEDGETDPFSVGVLLGWQWFPGDEFAIGLGIGIDYYKGTVSDNDGEFERYSGKVPALRFDIGYAW